MADGETTLTIDAALARRLKVRAEAAGQSFEDYARQALDQAAEPNGLGEADAIYADEMDRICDETLRTGGIPWEQFRERLLNLGKPR
jgi:plasmid stability protein